MCATVLTFYKYFNFLTRNLLRAGRSVVQAPCFGLACKPAFYAGPYVGEQRGAAVIVQRFRPFPYAVGEIYAVMAAVFPQFQVPAAGVMADGFLSAGEKGLKFGGPRGVHG